MAHALTLRRLDLRALPAPEPMERILDCLGSLQRGERLLALTPRPPLHCPDPGSRPHESLAALSRRRIAAFRDGTEAPASCPGHNPVVPARPWELVWKRAVAHPDTVGGGDFDQVRIEYTPGTGAFMLAVRGEPVHHSTTLPLERHLLDMHAFATAGPGRRTLLLGDSHEWRTVTCEAGGDDLVLTFATRSDGREPPWWAPRPGVPRRLVVRRAALLSAWREAQPRMVGLYRRATAASVDGGNGRR